jgi:hypothetical protein
MHRVLRDLPEAAREKVLKESVLLAAGLAGLGVALVFFVPAFREAPTLVLGAFVGVGVLLGALNALVRWPDRAAIRRRMRPDDHDHHHATGTILVRGQHVAESAWVYELKPPGGRWIEIDGDLFGALEPAMDASPGNQSIVSPRTWDHHDASWTLDSGTILYHRRSGTIFEVRGAKGQVLYHDPRYTPSPEE